MNERLQLADELKAKHRELRRFYRNFDRDVDGPMLWELSDYLLGFREDIPADVRYDPLPAGSQWGLADVHPRDASHLLWTIASLCRFSCTSPFFGFLRTQMLEGRIGPGEPLPADKYVLMPVPTRPTGEAATFPIMGRLLYGLLTQFFPKGLYGREWAGIPFRHRGQILGHIFVADSCIKREPIAVKQWSYESIRLFEDQTLESVCSGFLRQIRDLQLVPEEAIALVFLYSSFNDGYYLSGIRDLMAHSDPIVSEDTLRRFRSGVLQWVLARNEADQHTQHNSVSLQSRRIRVLTVPKSARILKHFTNCTASQLSTIQHHMFQESLRHAVGADTSEAYGDMIAKTLHICLPYQGLFIWRHDADGVGYHLSCGYTYDNVQALGNSLRERILTSLCTGNGDATNDLVRPPRDHLPSQDAVRSSTPIFLKVTETDLLGLPKGLFPVGKDINSRLILPLSSADEPRESGFLEIYFTEHYAQLAPFIGEIVSLATRAFLLCQTFRKEFNQRHEKGFRDYIHTLKNELGQRVIPLVETKWWSNPSVLHPEDQRRLQTASELCRRTQFVLQSFYVQDKKQRLRLLEEKALEGSLQQLCDVFNEEVRSLQLSHGTKLDLDKVPFAHVISESGGVVFWTLDPIFRSICFELVMNMADHADFSGKPPYVCIEVEGENAVVTVQCVLTDYNFGNFDVALAAKGTSRISGHRAIELYEDLIGVPMWRGEVVDRVKREIRLVYPVAVDARRRVAVEEAP